MNLVNVLTGKTFDCSTMTNKDAEIMIDGVKNVFRFENATIDSIRDFFYEVNVSVYSYSDYVRHTMNVPEYDPDIDSLIPSNDPDFDYIDEQKAELARLLNGETFTFINCKFVFVSDAVKEMTGKMTELFSVL